MPAPSIPGTPPRRHQVEVAGAAIDIDEVDADGGLPEAHLAGPGRRHRDPAPFEDLRASMARENHGAAVDRAPAGAGAAAGMDRASTGGVRSAFCRATIALMALKPPS